MTLTEVLALADRDPDAHWPHSTELVEALRSALSTPSAWRFQFDGRWVYTTHDPRMILSDVDPEPLFA